MSKRYLTLREVAERARTTESTVRYWCYVGKLRSVRPGRRRLVPEDELMRFLDPTSTGNEPTSS